MAETETQPLNVGELLLSDTQAQIDAIGTTEAWFNEKNVGRMFHELGEFSGFSVTESLEKILIGPHRWNRLMVEGRKNLIYLAYMPDQTNLTFDTALGVIEVGRFGKGKSRIQTSPMWFRFAVTTAAVDGKPRVVGGNFDLTEDGGQLRSGFVSLDDNELKAIDQADPGSWPSPGIGLTAQIPPINPITGTRVGLVTEGMLNTTVANCLPHYRALVFKRTPDGIDIGGSMYAFHTPRERNRISHAAGFTVQSTGKIAAVGFHYPKLASWNIPFPTSLPTGNPSSEPKSAPLQ